MNQFTVQRAGSENQKSLYETRLDLFRGRTFAQASLTKRTGFIQNRITDQSAEPGIEDFLKIVSVFLFKKDSNRKMDFLSSSVKLQLPQSIVPTGCTIPGHKGTWYA